MCFSSTKLVDGVHILDVDNSLHLIQIYIITLSSQQIGGLEEFQFLQGGPLLPVTNGVITPI